MNRNKKKALSIALVACLLAVLSFGTLAYFTDTDSVTNTFEIGSIDVVQNEKNRDGTDFTQNQMMLPIVNDTTPSSDPNYIPKIVTVSNIGENNAYVRTFIAVDSRIAPYIHLDLDLTGDWKQGDDSTVTIGEKKHKVYVFTYLKELEINTETPALLKGVYMDPVLDVKTVNGVKEFCYWDNTAPGFISTGYPVEDLVHVYVATQAVQSKGFSDAETALNGAFDGVLPDF